MSSACLVLVHSQRFRFGSCRFAILRVSPRGFRTSTGITSVVGRAAVPCLLYGRCHPVLLLAAPSPGVGTGSRFFEPGRWVRLPTLALVWGDETGLPPSAATITSRGGRVRRARRVVCLAGLGCTLEQADESESALTWATFVSRPRDFLLVTTSTSSSSCSLSLWSGSGSARLASERPPKRTLWRK